MDLLKIQSLEGLKALDLLKIQSLEGFKDSIVSRS